MLSPCRIARRGAVWAALLLALSCVQHQAKAPSLERAAPESVGLCPEKLVQARAILEEAVRADHVAGGVLLVARQGRIAFLESVGMQDREAGMAMRPDTLFRIASMTKPITSAAVLMLLDEGALGLDDPVETYIPEFAEPQVAVPTPSDENIFTLQPADRSITIRDLLTHTSGITYRFFGRKYLDAFYTEANVSDGLIQTQGTIAEGVARLAALPLKHQPGTAWEYGLSTDVLGRVIEAASGLPLDVFFQKRIFEPLGMRDTHFFLPPEKRARLAAVYTPGENRRIARTGETPIVRGSLIYSTSYHYDGPRTYFSGGAGLVSTAEDYARFCQMLLNGGVLDGARLLKPETVALMTSNRIGDMTTAWQVHGDGFGLGVGVFSEAFAAHRIESPGAFSWGGFFYTDFWVDPREELIGIFMTQLQPSALTLREDFRKAVTEALQTTAPR